MVNSLLFRWEDSQALQHHCGFCERPLSHPGARASCFGTHSEPCHRFHQAMFMRNRAHVCNYCSAIDEAHYKRHHELITQLRSLYESCGESDWSIVPEDPVDPRQSRFFESFITNCDTSTDGFASDEVATSKRERKDAKCLARAANRARVVTQEEIRYVESVLHPADSVTGGEGVSPGSPEELQLIEEHLRYNANVYNTQTSRRDLRKFAQIPDVDVDFEDEMERVLEVFRITELVKRNYKNRGLQGKALKTFDTLVKTFKDAIVEDLVLVKKDMMEIRMRRAGYLRYTSKTAYGIVEDRYTEKDWRTGERITSSSSKSSDISSQSEDTNPLESMSDRPMSSESLSSGVPDRRHLQHIHTRISGDDGLGQTVIEPYHAPLLPLTPSPLNKRSTILQLRMVENKENDVADLLTDCGWPRHEAAKRKPALPLQPAESDGFSFSPPAAKNKPPKKEQATNGSVWGKIGVMSPSYIAGYRAEDAEAFPAIGAKDITTSSLFSRSKAYAVQQTSDDGVVSLNGPDCAITPDNNNQEEHPVVSQKKAKKAQREAKRKEKRRREPEETSMPTAVGRASVDLVEQDSCHSLPSSPVLDGIPCASEGSISRDVVLSSRESVASARVDDSIGVDLVVSILPPLPLLPHTTHGKHDHWMRFSRAFTVDQLTAPIPRSFEGCFHGSSCVFESNDVPDCPFHEPHCSCGDPLTDQCYLVYPSKQSCSIGPYNRAYGERLLATYQEHDLTKGRVMLVDDDLVSYLFDDYSNIKMREPASMPSRLLLEHTESLYGHSPGRLMKQVLGFDRLYQKNMSMKHSVTIQKLQKIQSQRDGPKGSVRLCYCQVDVSQTASGILKEFGQNHVTCSHQTCEFGGIFHKRCIKRLGFEKVSRWYCTACEKHMKALAYRSLGVSYKGDNRLTSNYKRHFVDAEKAVGKMLARPDAMKFSSSMLQDFRADDMRGGLEVEDCD